MFPLGRFVFRQGSLSTTGMLDLFGERTSVVVPEQKPTPHFSAPPTATQIDCLLVQDQKIQELEKEIGKLEILIKDWEDFPDGDQSNPQIQYNSFMNKYGSSGYFFGSPEALHECLRRVKAELEKLEGRG